MIVDAHAHFGQGLRSTAPYGPLFDAYTADQLLKHLDAAGIDRAVCFAPRWQGGTFIDPDYRKANAAIAEGVRAHPDRLVGFCRVNPKFGSRAVGELRHRLDDDGFRGLKLDPETEAFSPLDLDLLGPLLDLCDEHHVPVLVHTNFHPAEPLLFLAMAKAYPRVPVILGHMGMRIVSDAVIAAEQAGNIYLETSSNMPAYIKRTVKRLGAARMLFGTDAPYNMPQNEIDRLRSLDLSPGDLERITSANLLDLIGGWPR